MSTTQNTVLLVARILLSFMFIYSGFGKLMDPSGTAGMITGAGMPAATALAYLAGLFELVTGVAVLIGFQTKIVGWALALFCVFTGVMFHSGTVAVPGWPDAALGWINALNGIMLMKNFTLAGAYILLATFGPASTRSTPAAALPLPSPPNLKTTPSSQDGNARRTVVRQAFLFWGIQADQSAARTALTIAATRGSLS